MASMQGSSATTRPPSRAPLAMLSTIYFPRYLSATINETFGSSTLNDLNFISQLKILNGLNA